jgi:hypothetical protein
VAVVGQRALKGTIVTLGRADAPRMAGIIVSSYLKSRSVTGLGIGLGYNYVRGTFVGLQIGLVNDTRVLKGIQLGLVNIARNNHGIARVLPILNAHL